MIELQGDLSVENGGGLPNKLMSDLHFTKEVIEYDPFSNLI